MDSMLEKYRRVYESLEDEESRDTYLCRLNYLISKDFRYIKNIVTAYPPKMRGRTMEDLLASMPQDRKFVLYGAGQFGKAVLLYVEQDKRFLGFCCQTKKKQEEGYLGYPCISPEELLRRKDLSVIISVKWDFDEIRQILKDGGYPEDLIFHTKGILRTEEPPDQYFGPEFMSYGEDEILIDAGCLDLNTSLQFREYCGGHVKKVYALEPDPENYAICLKKKEQAGFREAEILPLGVWSSRATLRFDATGNTSSHIEENGGIRVSVAPIDEIVDPVDRVTMIKMDVEGAELEALRGAKETIRRDRPKLAICIYHKPEDMTEIPLYIKELVPEYRLYIRHHTDIQVETVLYAVMPREHEI